MADEVPGEIVEEEMSKNGEEDETFGEDVKEELPPEDRVLDSERSLVSDFCLPGESVEEALGEDVWICEEVEEAGEYFAEVPPYEEEFFGEEEEKILGLEERRTLDSEYLKAVLGTPLTFAMLELVSKRPTDPIQFLAHFLLKWRWSGESNERKKEIMKGLTAERERYLQELRERERREMLAKEEEEERVRRAERVESSLEDDDLGEAREVGME